MAEANEEEQAAWRTAWRAIGSHAWRLLDQGHLKAAAGLARALGDVGASLSALLVSCPEGKREGLPSLAVCMSGAASRLLTSCISLSLTTPSPLALNVGSIVLVCQRVTMLQFSQAEHGL